MGLAVFNKNYYHSYFKVALFFPLFGIHRHTNGILLHDSTMGLAVFNNHYYHSYFKVVLFIPLFRIHTHTHQWHLTSWFYNGSCCIQQSLLPFIFQGSTLYSTVQNTQTHQWHLTSLFYNVSCCIQQSLLPFIFQGSTF